MHRIFRKKGDDIEKAIEAIKELGSKIKYHAGEINMLVQNFLIKQKI